MADVKAIMKELEQGVMSVYTDDKYIQYLDTMSKFHDYSVNNIVLILMQKPEATLVAGYKAWQKNFKRNVRKGEKAIHIIAPCQHKKKQEVVLADGTVEEKELVWQTYTAVSVFDVSQTDGEDLPTYGCDQLQGTVEGYKDLLAKIENVSPVPVTYEDVDGGANGFFVPSDGRIVVDKNMSELQTIKTLIHEVGHAILHNKDAEKTDRNTKEVQAESVAYVVCKMLGLDTSDYSFAYVAGWSKDKDAKELTASMEMIRNTANKIYQGVKAA